MEIAYISGPISKRDYDEAVREFNGAAAVLEELGYEVLNPLDNGLPREAPYNDHMVRDIEMLLRADIVFMLPDWEYSDGARVEHFIANTYKKRVYYNGL